MSDDNRGLTQREQNEQLFYGWFYDSSQTEPTYNPALGGPCILCGRNMMIFSDDVRTHNLMYVGQYASRSYFYRTHKSCADRDASNTAGDGAILDMIKANGD